MQSQFFDEAVSESQFFEQQICLGLIFLAFCVLLLIVGGGGPGGGNPGVMGAGGLQEAGEEGAGGGISKP